MLFSIIFLISFGDFLGLGDFNLYSISSPFSDMRVSSLGRGTGEGVEDKGQGGGEGEGDGTAEGDGDGPNS